MTREAKLHAWVSRMARPMVTLMGNYDEMSYLLAKLLFISITCEKITH